MKLKICSLCLLLLLFSCAAINRGIPGSVKAKDMQAELVQVYQMEGQRFFSVSPNGKYAAADFNDGFRGIRIIDLETMTVLLETNKEMGAFSFDSFNWSPDSTKAVITEDILRLYIDSDLWIFDIPDNNILHLFPDDVQNIMYSEDENASGEYQPAWSTDSKSIVFTRTSYGNKNTILGIAENYKESKFKTLNILSFDTSYISWTGLFPRKEHIYFTIDNIKRGAAKDGIYRIKTNGSEKERIAGSDPELFDLFLMDVSKDEQYALAVYLASNGIFGGKVYESRYRLINLEDFSSEILSIDEKMEKPFKTRFAVFSPQGDKIVSIQTDQSTFLSSLIIQDAGDQQRYELFSENSEYKYLFGNGMLQFRPPIFWSNDNFLFVTTGMGNELLKFKLSKK